MSSLIFLAGAFLAAWGFGLTLLPPGLVAGDCGELVTAAHGLGIAHPPGYPLWTLQGHAFLGLPLANPAFRISLSSLAAWALATAILGWALSRRWGTGTAGRWFGFGLSLFISLGPLALSQALKQEVFALHYLLSALLLVTLLESDRKGSFEASCFILGLALSHHHTILLVTPAWAWTFRDVLRRPLAVFRGLSLTLTAFSLYLFLPIRSSAQPWDNWGHPSIWPQFISHLLRRQYGGNLAGGDWSQGFWDMLDYLKQATFESWGLVLFLLAAAWFLSRAEVKKDAAALLAVLGTLILFPWLSHATPNPEHLQVNRAFFPPVLLWASPILLTGLRALWDRLPRTDARRALGVALGFLLISRVGWATFRSDQSVNLATERMGRNLFLNLPERSVFYCEGDTASFPLAYLQGVRALRPDTTLFDRTGGLFEDLYHILDVRHPGGPGPGDLILAERQFETTHPGRPLFYSESAYAPGRLLALNGLLFRVSGEDRPLTAPRGLWPRFRTPTAGPNGDFLGRETAARFYIFRAANSLRSGMPGEWVFTDFDQAVLLGADNHRLINNIALEYLKGGALGPAEKLFNQVIAIDPGYAVGWYNLGVLANQKGKILDSMDFYRKCLALDPAYTPARDGLAVGLFKTGRLPEAVDQWEELLRRDGGYPQAYRNFGMAIAQVDAPHAKMLLDRYLALAPEAPDRESVFRVRASLR